MMISKSEPLRSHNGPPVLPPCPKVQPVSQLANALNLLLADVFALYLKTKNFCWHMNEADSRKHDFLLNEHADQLFAITDDLARAVRKLGRPTIRSAAQIARLQRIPDADCDSPTATSMLSELRKGEQSLTSSMSITSALCERNGDLETASLLENCVDDSRRRDWSLYEAVRA